MNLLDYNFSDFEASVYSVVMNIPFGQRRSYNWVAKKIGMPGASRAVGNALNKNPYTVIIPCHRVILSSGSLGGYSKGLKKKAALLKTEKLLINSKLLCKLLRRDINY